MDLVNCVSLLTLFPSIELTLWDFKRQKKSCLPHFLFAHLSNGIDFIWNLPFYLKYRW